MLVFIKLGGSLITDKTQIEHFREDALLPIAQAIESARGKRDDLQLVIGHGSGSFGHVAAQQHGTMQGVKSQADWHGFAEVASAAARLNYLVTEGLRNAGLPIWRLQPSASARCEAGRLVEMAIHPIETAIKKGLVPLVYGDVALDSMRGGTIISTETILSYLATKLPVDRILLLGEVPGVLDSAGEVIANITPTNHDAVQAHLGGSSGTDVTGGMASKVNDMLALVQQRPLLRIAIMDGREASHLEQTLISDEPFGTQIST